MVYMLHSTSKCLVTWKFRPAFVFAAKNNKHCVCLDVSLFPNCFCCLMWDQFKVETGVRGQIVGHFTKTAGFISIIRKRQGMHTFVLCLLCEFHCFSLKLSRINADTVFCFTQPRGCGLLRWHHGDRQPSVQVIRVWSSQLALSPMTFANYILTVPFMLAWPVSPPYKNFCAVVVSASMALLIPCHRAVHKTPRTATISSVFVPTVTAPSTTTKKPSNTLWKPSNGRNQDDLHV